MTDLEENVSTETTTPPLRRRSSDPRVEPWIPGHVVAFTIERTGDIVSRAHCTNPELAPCRLWCSTCEGMCACVQDWQDYGHCLAVEWFDASGQLVELYAGPDRPLGSGPIEVRLDSDREAWTWRYVEMSKPLQAERPILPWRINDSMAAAQQRGHQLSRDDIEAILRAGDSQLATVEAACRSFVATARVLGRERNATRDQLQSLAGAVRAALGAGDDRPDRADELDAAVLSAWAFLDQPKYGDDPEPETDVLDDPDVTDSPCGPIRTDPTWRNA